MGYLRSLRKDSLHKNAKEIGISVAYLKNLEDGDYFPSGKILGRLSEYYHEDLAVLAIRLAEDCKSKKKALVGISPFLSEELSKVLLEEILNKWKSVSC